MKNRVACTVIEAIASGQAQRGISTAEEVVRHCGERDFAAVRAESEGHRGSTSQSKGRAECERAGYAWDKRGAGVDAHKSVDCSRPSESGSGADAHSAAGAGRTIDEQRAGGDQSGTGVGVGSGEGQRASAVFRKST